MQIYPQPVLSIGNDLTLCPGDSVLLDAGPALNNYKWNTGSQTEAIWAAAAGKYSVQTTTVNGCIVQASMTLSHYPAPEANLDPDSTLCVGTTRQLSADSCRRQQGGYRGQRDAAKGRRHTHRVARPATGP